MKKIFVLLLCLFTLTSCGGGGEALPTPKPQKLTSTVGRVLGEGECKAGFKGVEGTITAIDKKTVSLRAANKIYKLNLTEKFTAQLDSFKEKGHKIEVGTYLQIFYSEKKTAGSSKYNDVYDAELYADSFAVVYEN